MGAAENHLPANNQEGREDPSKNAIDADDPQTKSVKCRCPDDLDLDLECGTKTSLDVDVDEDASLWLSAKRLINNFSIQLDFWSLSEPKTEEPTFSFKGFCKPPIDPPQTGVQLLPQKSDIKNGGKNLRIAESRVESETLNVKPSGKKPPRPPKLPRFPKASGDSSKDRVIRATLRGAKLEKLKKKQLHKSKTSDSSLWALVCTLCFCVIMIMQGLFSQGNSTAQMTPAVAVQTEAFHVHTYDNHAADSESLHAIIQDQPSSLHHFGHALDKARHGRSDLKS